MVPNDVVFKDGWMSYDLIDKSSIHYSVNIEPQRILDIRKIDFKEIRFSAVQKSIDVVGGNPAIMLSGGIDSQVLLYSFLEAGVPFTPVIIDYKGKNSFDTDVALEVCTSLNIEPCVIEHDVSWFLNRFAVKFGTSHGLRSPQYTSHAWVCRLLQSQGFTGAVFGGNTFNRAPLESDHEWRFNQTAAQILDLPQYSHNEGWPIIGSFCSWDYRFALTLAALCKRADHEDYIHDKYIRPQRIDAYLRFGVPLLIPDKKYTGFEIIKRDIDINDKPGYFELLFRHPLYRVTPNQQTCKLNLTIGQINALDELSDILCQ